MVVMELFSEDISEVNTDRNLHVSKTLQYYMLSEQLKNCFMMLLSCPYHINHDKIFYSKYTGW